MIDTKEKRRSVIDFGRSPMGMGMPIPSGTLNEASRGHILNLYSGILPPKESFFFWRNRRIETGSWASRGGQTSIWQKPNDANDGGWTPESPIRDS